MENIKTVPSTEKSLVVESISEIKIPTENVIKKKSKKDREKIRKLLIETFDTPSLKAIVKTILTPHLTLKVIFLIFVVGLSSYVSYLVVQSIMDYLNYGVSTTSRTFYETPTLFPKTTFCNLNMYQTEYAFKKAAYDFSVLSNEERKKLGHDLDDILFDCYFNVEVCDSTDFIWSWDDFYGNCFTFNTGLDSNQNKTVLKESNMPGFFYGLQLTFYVNVFEELLFQTYQLGPVINYLGAVIRVGNSSYETLYSYGGGILVSAGSVTNIVVSREFNSMLPKPYSNCEIDSSSPKFIKGMDLYNLILESNYEYTQQLCFSQCYQKYIIQKYNCSFLLIPSLFNVSKCQMNYSINIWYSGEILDSKFINENCISSCPLECDQTLYETTTSYSLSNGYLYVPSLQSNLNLSGDFINRTLDSTMARESIVQVNIFYDRLLYTLTEESPQWDAVSLLGSIGGNLGLFLGVSFFSLCEIVEVIVEIFFVFKQRKINVHPVE